MALIRPERLDRRELHDQRQASAAGVVQFVAADLETPDFTNRAAQSEHGLAQGGDVPVTTVRSDRSTSASPQSGQRS